jgi:hypothetical protein
MTIACATAAARNSITLATVAWRHGDDYDTNRYEKQAAGHADHIVTIADDHDAMTSKAPNAPTSRRATRRTPSTCFASAQKGRA